MSEISTQEKAFKFNLDPKTYGSIAEIGAGQEVSRWFFQVGGAAGTVAKAMSAYDMKFSDAIYGVEESGRYVVESRLLKMLKKEYQLLETRLGEARGKTTSFFAFANTVTARSFKQKNECHGWVGIRYQSHPEAEPNEIRIHVRLLDDTNQQQQEVMGIFGVNLIYGAFYLFEDVKKLLKSLNESIVGRIEIDAIHMEGPDFKDIEDRIISLYLVELGHTRAVLFDEKGQVVQPTDVLYKKSLLIQRGTFRPVTNVHLDMLESGMEPFFKYIGEKKNKCEIIMEISMTHLIEEGKIDVNDFLSRVDLLAASGRKVLISNYPEYYKLRTYFKRFTSEPIGFILGVNQLKELFSHKYYEEHLGEMLGAMAELFSGDVRLLVYPGYKQFVENPSATKTLEEKELLTSENFDMDKKYKALYQFFHDNDNIIDIKNFNKSCLSILSRQIHESLKNQKSGWEDKVPKKVAEMIKKKKLFGWAA